MIWVNLDKKEKTVKPEKKTNELVKLNNNSTIVQSEKRLIQLNLNRQKNCKNWKKELMKLDEKKSVYLTKNIDWTKTLKLNCKK